MMARGLVRFAADLTGRTVPELLAKDRRPAVVRTRYAVIAELRERGHSLAEIGRALDMHHTSVLNGLWRARQLAGNPGFKLLRHELRTAA